MSRLLDALRAVRPGYWIAAGGALLFAVVFGRRNGRAVTPAGGPLFAYPSFVTGRKLTNDAAGDDGFVYTPPATLAAQAGLDVETYSLARMMASETSKGSAKEKAALAWAAINVARKRGNWPLLRLYTTVCYGKGNCQDTGLYGKQRMPGGNRFASTRFDPTDGDAYIATMILAGAWPDITQGADQFFEPAVQNAQFAQGVVPNDADAIIASWTAGGKKIAYTVPDVDRWVFFRPA